MNINHQLFICNCTDTSHQLIISRFEDLKNEKDKDLYFSIYMNSKVGFFHRLWVAFNYVTGRRPKYGEFAEIILSPVDQQRLMALLLVHSCSFKEEETEEEPNRSALTS